MTDKVKDALRMMPYGFYSITSCTEDDANAMVANWVTQASFEPQLIAVGLQKTCYTHGLIEKGGSFAVNMFKAEDSEALMPFTKGRSKNPDKMDEAEYEEAPETGCPVLEGAAAYVECRVVQLIDVGGDHDILVGEVIGGDVMKPAEAAEMLTLPDLGWSYAG
ncbi:MAG TPA: flavin reductase family protein [Candidatus Sulfomarinibacteraceae bacterium]|nr:flavin reductase family protein [Candidatus Sulfomarinibacteraceae bacterium]